jgi:tetratricopeptide (TPR) repeat protein
MGRAPTLRSELLRLARRLWRPTRSLEAGRAALAKGDVAAAEEHFASARRAAPSWADPCHELARCALARGDRTRSEQLALEALALDPDHRGAEVLFLEVRAWRHRPVMDAWSAYQAGDAARAKELFFAALGEVGARIPESERAGVLCGIGWSHYALAEFGWAADAFYAALLVAPVSVDARRGLAFSWYRLGWFEKSRAALIALAADQPDLSDAWAFLGWSEYALGQWASALAAFERACAADPTASDPLWGRAWSLYRLVRADESVPAFERAFAASVAHPSRFDLLEVARAYPAYRPLLAPLAAALASAGFAADAGACRALASELGLSAATPEGGARDRGQGAGSLEMALEALARGEPATALKLLDAAGPEIGDGDWRSDWLRCRALEKSGAHEAARALAISRAQRNPVRREWLEALARLESPTEKTAHEPPSP